MKGAKITFGLFLLLRLSMAETIHVPADRPTIQDGINAAQDGDVVLVDEGEYKECLYFLGKKITVASLYYQDQDTSHISKTIISAPDDLAENGSLVSFVFGETNESVLLGFTLTGGTGSVLSGGQRGGGAILIDRAAPKISHNIVRNNTVENDQAGFTMGGGICVAMSEHQEFTILEHNLVTSNHLSATKNSVYGGGIFVGANAKLTNNRIADNTVKYTGVATAVATGGGLCCKSVDYIIDVEIDSNTVENNYVESTKAAFVAGVDLMVTNTVFTDNVVRGNVINGTSRNNIPGMRVINRSDSLLLERNVFADNHSQGSAFCAGGGLFVIFMQKGTIRDNVFDNNLADEGAGLYLQSTQNMQVAGNQFHANQTKGDAAALYVMDSQNINIFSNTFENNVSGNVCAGCAVQHSDAYLYNNRFLHNQATYGGGISAADGAVVFSINNTLFQNKAVEDGCGIFAFDAEIYLLNTICWNEISNNSEIMLVGESSGVFASHSFIKGGYKGDAIQDEDPQFSDSSVQLQDSSPCIGAGILQYDFSGTLLTCPTFDCHSNQRPNPSGSNPDIGAFESTLAKPDTTTWVDNNDVRLLKTFRLGQNYPNPFNPTTRIVYELPFDDQALLQIYNPRGQHIRLLVDERQTAGQHHVVWDGKNDSGETVAAGLYICQLIFNNQVKTIKLLLIK